MWVKWKVFANRTVFIVLPYTPPHPRMIAPNNIQGKLAGYFKLNQN
jgi:hypothetical protein